MKSLLTKFFMLLSLLFFMQQTVYGSTAVGKIPQVAVALKKNLAAAAISLALIGGALPLAHAQQEEANPWTIVSEATPQYDYLHNVFNLHVASIAEPETQFLFPVAYLGKSVHGEDIFIAFARPAGTDLLEEAAADVDLSLINYRGEVREDISITGHAFAADALDGYFDLVVLSFAGTDLEISSPLQLGSYPYEDGGAVLRLASYQRHQTLPPMLEKEIAEVGAAGIRLGTRDDCRVVFNPNWASVGIGLSTCRGSGEKGFAHGSMVFHHHKLAGMQNASVNDFGLVRGISPDVVTAAASMLAGQHLPVEARGKLTTTWGALKRE